MGTPKGYMYAEVRITDPAVFFDVYLPKARPLLAAFGARVLSRAEPIDVERGGAISQVVLVEFESVARAQDFYNSPEYQEIIADRQRSSETRILIFEEAQ